MRGVLLATVVLALPALTACSQRSYATKIGDRTYKIEGPGVPGGVEGPNRRLAERLCPGGYRLVDSQRFKLDPETGTYTNWVIRCL